MTTESGTLVSMADEEANREAESKGKDSHQVDENNKERKMIETSEKTKIDNEDVYDGNEMKVQTKPLESHFNGSDVHNITAEDEEHYKNVTYDEHVDVYQVNCSNDYRAVFSKRLNDSDTKKCPGEPNIGDPNFKKKVGFSKEIIVIACDHEDMGHFYDYHYDQDSEDDHNQLAIFRDGASHRKVFGHCQDDMHDEMTINYADTIVSRNIFKTVSFSNQVTVIQDGDLVFTTNTQESPDYLNDGSIKLTKRPINRVEKLLTKLKKVVKKLEDKSKHRQSGNRDKNVLGDAEQDRSFHQVDFVKVENEKQVVFSDQIEFIQLENRALEHREPNLRRVTFSKEIIVIAYPNDDEDMLDASRYSKEYLGKSDEEIEQSSVNYASRVASSRNVCKTVSFSNEVTIIHDANLVFGSDSNESVKDGECGRKEEEEEVKYE